MPEFESSFNDDLTAFCREVGIEKVFTEEADFTPMSSELRTAVRRTCLGGNSWYHPDGYMVPMQRKCWYRA